MGKAIACILIAVLAVPVRCLHCCFCLRLGCSISEFGSGEKSPLFPHCSYNIRKTNRKVKHFQAFSVGKRKSSFFLLQDFVLGGVLT